MLSAEVGKLWVGTEDNGLYLIDGNQKIIRHYGGNGANEQSL